MATKKDETKKSFSWMNALFGFLIAFSMITAAGLLLFRSNEAVLIWTSIGLLIGVIIWYAKQNYKKTEKSFIFAGILVGLISSLLIVLNFFY